ncbi:uncharacterized protein LOC115890433 [Sitophilus oryzae]|uniref:Uncharacterized protein LOC115890433 n=1 Tax=Sitophilus oryzae TaxID=7048 RepID=A0A6J2YTB0_SITOR|nr:uncharacterized protein LOC115890433 [Sitophilus oryzae]
MFEDNDYDPNEIYKLHCYGDDIEEDSLTNSDENDALLQFKPALYTYEELSDAIVIEPEGDLESDTAELAIKNVGNSLKNVDESKYIQDRQEEIISKSKQEAIVKEKIESLTLPDYCYLCEAKLISPHNATAHYKSKRHKLNIAMYRDEILSNLKSEQQDLEAIVKKKIENLTLPDYCYICDANLISPHNATSHYNSKRHKFNIGAHRDEILNNLKSQQQEALKRKNYFCFVCDIEFNSKDLYDSHVQSSGHKLYSSAVKNNISHETIVNINSDDCNISKGENETAACYNTNEKEPVIDDLKEVEIKPIINDGEMLEKINTNQKEPIIDDLEKNLIEIVVNNEEMLDQINEQIKDTFHELSGLLQKFIDCGKTERYEEQAEVYLLLKQLIDKIYCANSPLLIETLKVFESVDINLHNPVQIREEKNTQLKNVKICKVTPFKHQSTRRFGYFKVTVMATVTIGFIWWLIKKRQPPPLTSTHHYLNLDDLVDRLEHFIFS